jgi:hypothetical protein
MAYTSQTGHTHRSDCQACATWDEQQPRDNSPKSKTRSPESLHELVQEFWDSRNTSWGVHSQVIAQQTRQINRNRRNPAKNSNPRTPKTPKSSPFTHGFGRGITGQRTTKGSHKFPPPNPQEQGPENTPRKTPRDGSENHHQEQSRTTQQGLEEPR